MSGNDDILLTGEASSDLVAWTGADAVEVSRTDNHNGTETIVVRHRLPFSSAPARRFLRLSAILSP